MDREFQESVKLHSYDIKLYEIRCKGTPQGDNSGDSVYHILTCTDRVAEILPEVQQHVNFNKGDFEKAQEIVIRPMATKLVIDSLTLDRLASLFHSEKV